jgi:hypothetical protein
METIKTHARVGKDGLLNLEVLVVIQPIPAMDENRAEWLAFLEQTAGSLSDDPIERPPQGDYDVREPVE